MTIQRFVCRFFALVLATVGSASAQNSQPESAPPDRSIRIAVAVDSKSGQPVTGLTEHDFTVLENKTTRPISRSRWSATAKSPFT